MAMADKVKVERLGKYWRVQYLGRYRNFRCKDEAMAFAKHLQRHPTIMLPRMFPVESAFILPRLGS